MNCRLSIDLNGIIPQDLMDDVKIHTQDAMANEFYEITMANFGPGEGENRPEEWPDLKQGYANEAHDGDVTPTLILSGDLQESITPLLGELESASVYTDSPYANHQWGFQTEFHGKVIDIPARPYFPIVGDENESVLTDYAAQKCLEAAQRAVDRKLQ